MKTKLIFLLIGEEENEAITSKCIIVAYKIILGSKMHRK